VQHHPSVSALKLTYQLFHKCSGQYQ